MAESIRRARHGAAGDQACTRWTACRSTPAWTQQGRPTKIDAIDQDERKIRDIADRLHRRGFGVMRQRNPRAGKVFYTLKATWAGAGEPPDDPFDGPMATNANRDRS